MSGLFVGLVLGLLMLIWFGGGLRGWHQVERKGGGGPHGLGESIAFVLGCLAILAGIVFLLGQALR